MATPPVLHIKGFCPDPENVFKELSEYPWRQEKITMFGKTVDEPRKVMWFAQNGQEYKYAGKINKALEMTQLLIDIGEYASVIIKEHLGRTVEFNSVFCNYYNNGDQYIGWHADDEPGIASDIIASVSFGATRDFKVRNNKKQVWTFPLGAGDLAVMYDDCQDNYKHSVPKRKKVTEPRINLTYRVYDAS